MVCDFSNKKDPGEEPLGFEWFSQSEGINP